MVRFTTVRQLASVLVCLLVAETHTSAQSKTQPIHTGSPARVATHPAGSAAHNGRSNTPVQFEGHDDRTAGNWPGVYGKQAFMVPIPAGVANFNTSEVQLGRGSGIPQGKAATALLASLPEAVSDLKPFDPKVAPNAPLTSTRVPLGGHGLTTRNNVTFSSTQSAFPDPKTGKLQMAGFPLVVRADTNDGRPHRLSLYFLDYLRTGRAVKIEFYDLHGRLLDTHRVDHYGDGTYLRFRITGTVLAVISTLTKAPPQLAAAFVDAE